MAMVGNKRNERFPQQGGPNSRLHSSLIALNPVSFFKSAMMASIIWLLALAFGASYSAFMFHGRLADYASAGMQIFLISSIVLCLLCALFSSNSSVVPSPQDSPLVILATMATNMVALAPMGMSDETLFMSIVAAMILSSFIIGIIHFVMGYLNISILMRYFPFPVVGGVLAGMGCLLLKGGLTLITGLELGWANWTLLFSSEYFFSWMPIGVIAFALLLILRRSNNMLILPLAVGLSLVLYFLSQTFAAGMAGMSVLEAAAAAMPSAAPTRPLLSFEVLPKADFGLVLSQWDSMAVLLVISTFNVLVYLSATELIFRRELNFNREMEVAGAANVVSALFGSGMVGFHAVAYSSLAHLSGGNGRVTNGLLALMFLLTLAMGHAIGSLFPTAIMGGLLIFVGFSFLSDWLIDSRSQMPMADTLTIVAMMIVIVAFGLAWGIFCGILICITFFVLQYSQTHVVRQQFTGMKLRSRIERSFLESRLLQTHGEKMQILRLQGYIFFGTGFQLYRSIRSQILNAADGHIHYILLDFRMVQGMDVSSAVDFRKLQHLAETHGIHIAFTNTSEIIRLILTRTFSAADEACPRFFEDLDHALEWCEESILAESHLSDLSHVPLDEQFDSHVMLQSAEIDLLRKYLKRVKVKTGDIIVHQGERSDSMFLIESGRVDIVVTNEYDHDIRLRSMGAGVIVGEVGFYLSRERTASVVATESVILQQLDREALYRMAVDDPHALAILHNFVACTLSERLSSTNHLVEELME